MLIGGGPVNADVRRALSRSVRHFRMVASVPLPRTRINTMVKLGWAFTVYLCFSFALFITTSNTITGGIIYLFLLLPFYGVVLLGLWGWAWKNRTKTAKIKYWIWGIVLALQIATILASPGNCFGAKQGARCYSNLQVLLSDVPSAGPSSSPHWNQVEDAFLGLLAAYGVALGVGLSRISTVKSINTKE